MVDISIELMAILCHYTKPSLKITEAVSRIQEKEANEKKSHHIAKTGFKIL